MMLSAPMTRRVVIGGFTLRKQMADSPVPLAVTGSAMRRALRPDGRLVRRSRLPRAARYGIRWNRRGAERQRAHHSPTSTRPAGSRRCRKGSRPAASKRPAWLIRLLRRYPNLPLWLLIFALLVALLFFVFGLSPAGSAIVRDSGRPLCVAAQAENGRYRRRLAACRESGGPGDRRHASSLPGFHARAFGVAASVPASGTTDNASRAAIQGGAAVVVPAGRRSAEASPPVVRPRIDPSTSRRSTATTLDPARAIPLRYYKAVKVPARIKDGLRETFTEAMAYPRIDEPMYRPLADIASELFLPNIGLIPPDSISLLETNQQASSRATWWD